MRLLNGRMLGDSSGIYTAFKHNGSSVVDYIAVNEILLKEICAFRVNLSLHLSDHALISATFVGSTSRVVGETGRALNLAQSNSGGARIAIVISP